METLKKNKRAVLLITYTVLLVFFLFNIEKVNSTVSAIFSTLMPVIYGIVFAFLVGLIARGFKALFKKMGFEGKRAEVTSVVFGYIGFIALVAGFLFLVIPATIQSISNLTEEFPHLWNVTYDFVKDMAGRLNLSAEQWNTVNEHLNQTYSSIYAFITNKLPDVIAYAFNFVNFMKNLGFGFILSIYILIAKKSLVRQVKKSITVFFSEEHARKIIKTGAHANEIFRKYISGQVIVSVVLGILCYVCMIVFRMPDAVLISLIIGMSNLIPIVGPILGTIPTTLIVMMKSPILGFWFLVMIIALQQFDNNVLTPKIVGDSVGLGGMWVIIAILVAGSLFGVGGMIIAVPTMGVIYHLMSDYINSRYDKEKFDNIVNEEEK